MSKSLSDYIVNYSSLRENVENQSDHAPVVLRLNIFIESHSYTPSNHWNNAIHNQIDTLESVLDDNLSVIDIPYKCLYCTNVLCNDNDHVTSIKKLQDDRISACIDASENILTTRNNNKNIPG